MSGERRREWGRRLGMVVLGPLILLAALEYVLWVFDVAPPPEGAATTPEQAALDGVRARIGNGGSLVCLGGSTVAGAPFEQRMNLCTIMAESLGLPLINLAASAQDSSTVRKHAALACAQPQALVFVSTGHNEFLNLTRFRHGAPPETARAAAQFLDRFRFYRLIASLVQRPPARPDQAGEAPVNDAEVYDGFEENLRAIASACAGNHLIFATVIGNPDLQFPPRDITLREWVRRRRAGRTDDPPWCPHCIRAGPEINARVRRVAADLQVPLVDMEPLVAGRPGWSVFWDQCHPRPEVHLEMARAVIARAQALGWVGAARPPRYELPQTLVDGAERERALYVARFDPLWASERLASLPSTTPEHALGVAVTAFLVDDPPGVDRALAKARALLHSPGARAALEACVRQGRPGQPGEPHLPALPCMPWPSEAVMSAAEKAELVAAARGGDPLLLHVLEQF